MDVLAVFKRRSDAIKVFKALQTKRIACATVSTPSYLRVGCGLSVLLPRGYEEAVKEAVANSGADSFYGFFARR